MCLQSVRIPAVDLLFDGLLHVHWKLVESDPRFECLLTEDSNLEAIHPEVVQARALLRDNCILCIIHGLYLE